MSAPTRSSSIHILTRSSPSMSTRTVYSICVLVLFVTVVALNSHSVQAKDDKDDKLSAYRERYFRRKSETTTEEATTERSDQDDDVLKLSASEQKNDQSSQPSQPVADDKPPRFSIGLGVLAPSYSQKFGSDGKTRLDFNSEKDGAFSYSLSNVQHPVAALSQVKDDKKNENANQGYYPTHNMGYAMQPGQPYVNIFHRQGAYQWPGYNFGPALVGSTTTTTTTTPAPPTQNAYPSVFSNAYQFNPLAQQAAIPYFNPFLQPAQSSQVKVEEKKEEKKDPQVYGRAPIDLYSLMSIQKGRALPELIPAAQANQQNIGYPQQAMAFPGMQGYGGGVQSMGGYGMPGAGQGFNMPYAASQQYPMYGGGGYGGVASQSADPTAGMSIFGAGASGAGYGPMGYGQGMGGGAGYGGLQTSGSSAYPQYGQTGGYGASIYNRGYGGYPSAGGYGQAGYGQGMGGGLLGAMSSGVASWLNPFRAPLSLFGF